MNSPESSNQVSLSQPAAKRIRTCTVKPNSEYIISLLEKRKTQTFMKYRKDHPWNMSRQEQKLRPEMKNVDELVELADNSQSTN